jgi:hypothetical protein
LKQRFFVELETDFEHLQKVYGFGLVWFGLVVLFNLMAILTQEYYHVVISHFSK